MGARKEEGGGGGSKEREEAAREDYTIIQITAGNNLVADVSRSTMPTTHRRACVCAYTLRELLCPETSRRVRKWLLINQHELLNNTAYKNNDRELVSS